MRRRDSMLLQLAEDPPLALGVQPHGEKAVFRRWNCYQKYSPGGRAAAGGAQQDDVLMYVMRVPDAAISGALRNRALGVLRHGGW